MIFDTYIKFADNDAITSFFGDHAFAHQTYGELLLAKFGQARQVTFDVSDEGALKGWLEMNQQLRSTLSGQMPLALTNWLQFHNAMHQSEAKIMGVTSLVDLSTVDFRNPDEFYNWMDLHQQIHTAESTTLGI